MVLKKPYAFLIKNFKIIHILLFIFAMYVNNYYSKISSFYRNYSSTIFYDIGEASNYLPTLVFVSVTVMISVLIVIIYLMRNKKKPFSLYILSIVYYIVIIISMFFAYNQINTLFEATIDQTTSRLYRDIYLIIGLPQYYFIIMYLLRGIGFDIKKFNFNKDLEELEIKTEDNEEFEFIIGNDSYIIKRKLHRLLREIYYIYKENQLIMNAVAGTVSSIIIILIMISISSSIHRYHMGSTLNAEMFTIKLNKAYITNYDYTGKEISSDKKYLLLDMTITNKGENELRYSDLYIKYGNNKQSILNYGFVDSFSDIGPIYKGDIIKNEPTNLIFVYEVPSNTSRRNLLLSVFKGYKKTKNGIVKDYREFKFTATNIDSTIDSTNSEINKNIELGNKLYGYSSLNIKNIEIKDKYEYSYNKCNSENVCESLTDIIIPRNQIVNSLLIIDYTLTIDNNSLLSKHNNSSDKTILNKFSKILYTKNNKEQSKSIYGNTYENLPNKILYEIPKSAKENLKFNIKTRENNYIYNIIDN